MGCCGWNEVHKVPTVPSGPSPTDDLHLIALRRAHAEVALLEVTGGAPICRVDGPGTALIKAAEGRLAALAELERAVRGADAPARAVTAELLDRWRAGSGAVAARGAAWEAYHSGGIGELEAVVHDLDAQDLDAQDLDAQDLDAPA